MTPFHLTFINGAVMMGCIVAGLFFLRFWRDAKDRFFLKFALAFILLSIDRIAMVLAGGINEVDPKVYFIRCAAFLIIIWAVIDKNRGSAEG